MIIHNCMHVYIIDSVPTCHDAITGKITIGDANRLIRRLRHILAGFVSTYQSSMICWEMNQVKSSL